MRWQQTLLCHADLTVLSWPVSSHLQHVCHSLLSHSPGEALTQCVRSWEWDLCEIIGMSGKISSHLLEKLVCVCACESVWVCVCLWGLILMQIPMYALICLPGWDLNVLWFCYWKPSVSMEILGSYLPGRLSRLSPVWMGAGAADCTLGRLYLITSTVMFVPTKRKLEHSPLQTTAVCSVQWIRSHVFGVALHTPKQPNRVRMLTLYGLTWRLGIRFCSHCTLCTVRKKCEMWMQSAVFFLGGGVLPRASHSFLKVEALQHLERGLPERCLCCYTSCRTAGGKVGLVCRFSSQGQKGCVKCLHSIYVKTFSVKRGAQFNLGHL